MKYDGIVYDYLEENGKVREAIVTDSRIALTFEQGNSDWQIAATSRDGKLYRGVLTTGGPNPECVVELGVYKAKSGSIIVFGEWWSRENGNSYQFVFRLFPQEPSKPAAKRTARTTPKSRR